MFAIKSGIHSKLDVSRHAYHDTLEGSRHTSVVSIGPHTHSLFLIDLDRLSEVAWKNFNIRGCKMKYNAQSYLQNAPSAGV